jgi:hypothetical protein
MYNSIGSSTDSSGDRDFVDGFLVDFGIELNDEIGGSRNTATVEKIYIEGYFEIFLYMMQCCQIVGL